MARPSLSQEPSLNLRLFGTEEEPAARRKVTTGPLSAVLQSGALRQISIGGVEAIRGIAFIVRDKNWGTFFPNISDLKVIEKDDGFRISYSAVCRNDDRSLTYEVTIVGAPDGSLDFSVTGAAKAKFLTSRTGFVVLHPIEGVAGQPVTVTHTDGSTEDSFFPTLISPAQPFLDIRALSHEIAPGLSVTCTMEGDAFEMEDHRNWMDASYKTYIRPLSRPHPYTLEAGEEFVQRVGLVTNGSIQKAIEGSLGADCIVSIENESVGRVPEFALAVHPDFIDAALGVAGLVKRAEIGRLVCTFDSSSGHGVETMAAFKRIGEETESSLVLEAVLPLRDGGGAFTDDLAVLHADIETIKQCADRAGVDFEAVSASPACYYRCYQPIDNWPSAPPLRTVYTEVRRAFPEATIVGGMHSYFTELNRYPNAIDGIDVVTHTTSPIVHAEDDMSVMESLQALPWIFKSTRARAKDKAYWIGPTAIAMRMNPYGTKTLPNPNNIRRTMSEADPRQRGLFNAAWTLGYISRAVAGGVAGLCLSSLAGPNAIAWQEMDWEQPWFDEHGSENSVFPVYHVIAGLASRANANVRAVEYSDANNLAVLAIDTNDRPELWLANLTPGELNVELPGVEQGASIEKLDTETFEVCCSDPDGFASTATPMDSTSVSLGGYAVAHIS